MSNKRKANNAARWQFFREKNLNKRLKILLREDYSQLSHKDYERNKRERGTGDEEKRKGEETKSIEREGGRTGNREGKTERKGREEEGWGGEKLEIK